MTIPIESDIAQYLSEQQGVMEEALARLVEINSFTENAEGGRRVARELERLFALPGLQAKTHPSQRYADHLTFTSASRGAFAPVALIGHLDTVFPPGSFEGYRRDGDLIRGAGGSRHEGGPHCCGVCPKAIAEMAGLDAAPPLNVVIVSDEEVGSPEGRVVIAETIKGSSASLVFEAGRAGDAIVTRRKGIGTITATARGHAAHAGNAHHQGSNAIWALAKWIDRVQMLTDYDRGFTFNVGKVGGGVGPNTVPDHAEAILDVRFLNTADGERLVAKLHEIMAEINGSFAGTVIALEGGIIRPPLERTAASESLMSEYAECARLFGLGGDEAPLVGGGSDASTSSVMGIASIDGLGPRGEGFHTRDERIEKTSLVPKAKALAIFLVRRGTPAPLRKVSPARP